ncbi:MAG: NAD(P)/FAD-dependent oxidoreductase [Myxococcota bacterium]
MVEPVVILGAGLAGLTCALELGSGYILLERDAAVGGTARSTQLHGFTFDVTGHWLHLSDPEVKTLVTGLMGDDLVRVARRAEVHSHGVRTPYPFQANTYGLPAEVVAECVLGYFKARELEAKGAHPPARTLEDFIRQRMGDGIARHFMIPYNTKLWTVPPSAMAHTWCGRFVPVPTPEEVVMGALTPRGAGHALGYNSSFYYPKSGGIQTLADRLAAKLGEAPRLSTSIDRIDTSARTVNDTVRYRSLVSTLPLTELVKRITDAPESVRQASAKLRSTSVTYWNVGFRGANGPHDAHWVYFPEASVPFYRAGSASAALPSLAPAGHRSYYVEVAHRTGTACPVSDAEILAGMREVGLAAPGDTPVLIERHTVPIAYVIMDDDYGPARAHVLEWLAARDIHSVGRYGAWTYDSMEGAMVQGREAARRLRK